MNFEISRELKSAKIFYQFSYGFDDCCVHFEVSTHRDIKADTHEGACSRSLRTLLQHAPGAKLPRLHQRFLAKKYVAQQTFCSWVLLPQIKLVWYLREQAPGTNLLHESVSGASSLECTEICLPWNDASPVGQSNWLIFFIHNSLRTHFQNGGQISRERFCVDNLTIKKAKKLHGVSQIQD